MTGMEDKMNRRKDADSVLPAENHGIRRSWLQEVQLLIRQGTAVKKAVKLANESHGVSWSTNAYYYWRTQ